MSYCVKLCIKNIQNFHQSLSWRGPYVHPTKHLWTPGVESDPLHLSEQLIQRTDQSEINLINNMI